MHIEHCSGLAKSTSNNVPSINHIKVPWNRDLIAKSNQLITEKWLVEKHKNHLLNEKFPPNHNRIASKKETSQWGKNHKKINVTNGTF